MPPGQAAASNLASVAWGRVKLDAVGCLMLSVLRIHYPYLVVSLVLVVGAVAALKLRRTQRRAMLLSGLLAAPWGLAGFSIEGVYWHPARVTGLAVGPEDVLWSFACGVLVWPIATCLVARRLVVPLRGGTLLRRAGWWFALGAGTYAACRLSGVPLMAAVAGPALAVAALVLLLRPCLWPIAATGGAAFTLLYLGVASITFLIWPHALGDWNLASLSGVWVLGVPIEEVGWGLAFGATWPLVIAHAFDARIRSGLSQEPTAESGSARSCG